MGGYLAVIVLLARIPLGWREKLSASLILRGAVSLHSLVLCLGSLGMFLGGLLAYWLEYERKGQLGWLVCKDLEVDGASASAGAPYFVAYVYYLSKYLELLDTCILVLKGKSLSLLHVFHHAVMPLMCWLWLQQRQSLHEIALLTNTFIHVIMYAYYFLCSLNRPPRWKKVVTQSQILQVRVQPRGYSLLLLAFRPFAERSPFTRKRPRESVQ